MKNKTKVSRKLLLKEVKAGFEFANDITGIVTLMQDVLALTLIKNDRDRTKTSGAIKRSEMELLKKNLPINYPGMTESQVIHMVASIDLHFSDLEDTSTIYQDNPMEEPSLDEWHMVIVNQMIRQENFELAVAASSAEKSPQ